MLGAYAVVVLAACSDHSSPTGPTTLTPVEQSSGGSSATLGGFSYSVSTAIADVPTITDPLLRPVITSTATVRNDRAESVTVTYGACNVSLVAYTNPDRTGNPVWRSAASLPWEGTYGRGCILPLYERRLAPGEQFSLGSYSSRVIEVIGDSLPNGRYYLSATLSISSAPNGVTVPAGDFELALDRPPLREAVTHDFITYKASSVVAGGVVQGKVVATLTNAGGMLAEFPRECVMEIVAYRSRERRDAAPRSGAPDWRSSRKCASGWQQVNLSNGQSTVFDHNVPAREILGSSLPNGTYYFAAIVHTRTRHVWLSAGSGALQR
jgi:hypothetical protein